MGEVVLCSQRLLCHRTSGDICTETPLCSQHEMALGLELLVFWVGRVRTGWPCWREGMAPCSGPWFMHL